MDIHGPCCHQRAHRNPGSGLQPVVILVSADCVAAAAMLVWVACAATEALMLSSHRLLPRAMSGSMTKLQLRSVLMSEARVTSGSHRNHAKVAPSYTNPGTLSLALSGHCSKRSGSDPHSPDPCMLER